jgi:hypothetical protein
VVAVGLGGVGAGAQAESPKIVNNRESTTTTEVNRKNILTPPLLFDYESYCHSLHGFSDKDNRIQPSKTSITV